MTKAKKIESTENVTVETKLVFRDLDQKMSISDKIRTYAADGHNRSDIAKFLNIRYQHVRNVLTVPLKRVKKDEPVIETKVTEKKVKGPKKVAKKK